MSLTGNLEDLPLLDILQIVSFSKKTGQLTISTGQGEGAIVFREGLVVASFTWDSPPLDARAASLPPERRRALLRNRIGLALEQLIRLREGEFSFSLSEEPPAVVGTREVSPETLAEGINPQELLLELARGMDEDRRDSAAALEASFPQASLDAPFSEAELEAPFSGAFPEEGLETPLSGAFPELAAPEPTAVLLVDDEREVRRVLAEQFRRAGREVVEAEDPDRAVREAGRLAKAGTPFLLVADLGMPTSGGSSFQGGFEVVRRLAKMGLKPAVLLMSDRLGANLQERARLLGISRVVLKPGLSKLDPAQFEGDLRRFARQLLEDVLPRLRSPLPSAPGAAPSPAFPSAQVPADAAALSRDFAFLQRSLEDLRTPGGASHVSALVMKVAREFFERGLLFLVRNEEMRGLGGFGPAPAGGNLNALVREVVIPLSEPSVFREVAYQGRAFSGPLPDGRWSRHLQEKVGSFQAEAVALLPLLTHRETVALLCGDNPVSGRAPGRLEALEVFLNQAGISLENALLQRKLLALQGREVS